MLQIKGVSKAYGKKVVLDDITMSVAPGDIALMMGGSGTGKSTLLRVLCNLESVDAGVITLDGVAVDTFHDHTVGMVFQQFHLFDHLYQAVNIGFHIMPQPGVTQRRRRMIERVIGAVFSIAWLPMNAADFGVGEIAGHAKPSQGRYH